MPANSRWDLIRGLKGKPTELKNAASVRPRQLSRNCYTADLRNIYERYFLLNVTLCFPAVSYMDLKM